MLLWRCSGTVMVVLCCYYNCCCLDSRRQDMTSATQSWRSSSGWASRTAWKPLAEAAGGRTQTGNGGDEKRATLGSELVRLQAGNGRRRSQPQADAEGAFGWFEDFSSPAQYRAPAVVREGAAVPYFIDRLRHRPWGGGDACARRKPRSKHGNKARTTAPNRHAKAPG
ncbi:hypothetical protein K505DRAFT_90957 [Melanomma pulvis-pyrius CBS 109.77]|uniref:Secreted protein n=1 Tax=Melanomma pulvis-pyrius CBS 109.77 TaxID=1314802 RepID=A0A6A6X0D5_9PLEO|nr:hypothetical protein K505DRAFT_90957 [Melanomma pulvis-pyrius CBS 109.77]